MNLRIALNGTNRKVKFFDKHVYHKWDTGEYNIKVLGKCLDKEKWIRARLSDQEKFDSVNEMLKNWNLYENGWLYTLTKNNKHVELYYYLCQMGSYGLHRPKELTYLHKLAFT